MIIRASDRVSGIGSYAFAEIDKEVLRLEKQGIKVIDFGVGDPRSPTPSVIRSSCQEGIDTSKSSGYPSYIGTEEFRQTVVDWMGKRFSVSLDCEKEVTTTIGAKEAVFNFHEGFINSGDFVLIPNPGYPPYERGTLFAEGEPYFLNLLQQDDFLVNLDKIPEEIVRKAKVLWINYPNNPTTVMADKDFYQKIIDFCHKNDIIIASDECYSEIYYDEKPVSILELDREGIVVFQSLSKRSAMTGYRVGFLAGDKRIIDIFRKVKTNIDSGTPIFIQNAAVAALRDEEHVETMRNEYKAKRDIMGEAFRQIGLKDCTPQATIYIWQKVPLGLSSLEFSRRLIKEKAIVTTPGSVLSREIDGINPGDKYVRFALVPSIKECKEAARRIKEGSNWL